MDAACPGIEVSQEHLAGLIEENLRLRARVDEFIRHSNGQLAEIRSLKAEVERLCRLKEALEDALVR